MSQSIEINVDCNKERKEFLNGKNIQDKIQSRDSIV